MKKTIIVIFCLVFAQHIYAQEFATNANGLMYSEAAMSKLKHLVEKEHIRYKSCDLDRKYISFPQTSATYIIFSSKTDNLKDVLADLKLNKSFGYLKEKYSKYIHTVDSNKLVIDYNLKNGRYGTGTPERGYDYFGVGNHILKTESWTFEYSKKSDKEDDYDVYALMLHSNFETKEIPFNYARLIQYVDCMVDTSAKVHLANYDDYYNTKEKTTKELTSLAEYVKKRYKDLNFQKLSTKDSLVLIQDKTFMDYYNKAFEAQVNMGYYNYLLHNVANALGQKERILLIKRCQIIIGRCSQDDSPRRHALEIAELAGETQSWDIFLRAHLDIMNDRFERMSDGSYAWEQRQTYIKELEELNLNVVDLLIGMSLRSPSVANNHYNGTVWRLGKALAETKFKNKFEEQVCSMMKDNKLDGFNRGLLFLLYNSYLRHLSINEHNTRVTSLKASLHVYPQDIQQAITSLKERTEKDEE
jgi:hypothetical protein